MNALVHISPRLRFSRAAICRRLSLRRPLRREALAKMKPILVDAHRQNDLEASILWSQVQSFIKSNFLTLCGCGKVSQPGSRSCWPCSLKRRYYA